MNVKTREQVKADLRRKGLSVSAWAAAHNLNSGLVYEILRGTRKCTRGDSHRAAVLLGLKDGEIVDPRDIGQVTFNKPGRHK